MSFIGWIDFSEDDRRRARDYLRALESGTIDELGFGIMRDALSNIFFPATSTNMTHARFFVFVPVIHHYIEKQGLSGERARRKVTQIEQNLRTVLAAGGHINIRQQTVQRYPSVSYWPALTDLLILTFNWSRRYYFDQLVAYQRSKKTMLDDDKTPHRADVTSEHWDREFLRLWGEGEIVSIGPNGVFDDGTDIDLRSGEAAYLKAKFLSLAERRGPSLMSCALDDLEWSQDFLYPWEWPLHGTSETVERLRHLAGHAEHYSMLMKGAAILYYDLLAKKRVAEGMASSREDLLGNFEMWWSVAQRSLCTWKVDEFVSCMSELTPSPVRRGDRVFLKEFCGLLSDSTRPSGFFYHEKARAIIRKREITKRPDKSRLKYRKYLLQWELKRVERHLQDGQPYWPDRRADIAARFVKQIKAGIRGKDRRDA